MKEVYILLTHTGTVLSGIVKYYTKNKYSHISIALDHNLNELYSFGRLKPYNPFKAGFVHEEIHGGTYARFINTKAALYSLKVTEDQYLKISSIIYNMKKHKEKYKFNILGLFMVSINKKYRKDNTFYCAEFVKYVLKDTCNTNDLPEIIKPMDFVKLQNIKLIYEGLLKEYT